MLLDDESNCRRAFVWTTAIYSVIFVATVPIHHWTVRYQHLVEQLKVMASVNYYFVQTYGYLWFTVIYLSMSFLYVNPNTGMIPMLDIKRIFGSFFVVSGFFFANTVWFFGSNIFERIDVLAGAYCDFGSHNIQTKIDCETVQGRWVSVFDVSGHCYLLLCITLLCTCELLGNFCTCYRRSFSFKRRKHIYRESITNTTTDLECSGYLNENASIPNSKVHNDVKNIDSAQHGTFQTLEPDSPATANGHLVEQDDDLEHDHDHNHEQPLISPPPPSPSSRPMALIALNFSQITILLLFFVLLVLWLIMYTTTNLFFHTTGERLCGLLIGVVVAAIAITAGTRFSSYASLRHNCRIM